MVSLVDNKIVKNIRQLNARYICILMIEGVLEQNKTVREITRSLIPNLFQADRTDFARAKRVADYIFIHLLSIDNFLNSRLRKTHTLKLEIF